MNNFATHDAPGRRKVFSVMKLTHSTSQHIIMLHNESSGPVAHLFHQWTNIQ